jgi:hypothetical protein
MKLTKYFQMKRKEGSMMLFVSDDLHDDLVDEREVLILVILDDLVDEQLILILEICLDEYLDEDFEVDEVKCVNERI